MDVWGSRDFPLWPSYFSLFHVNPISFSSMVTNWWKLLFVPPFGSGGVQVDNFTENGRVRRIRVSFRKVFFIVSLPRPPRIFSSKRNCFLLWKKRLDVKTMIGRWTTPLTSVCLMASNIYLFFKKIPAAAAKKCFVFPVPSRATSRKKASTAVQAVCLWVSVPRSLHIFCHTHTNFFFALTQPKFNLKKKNCLKGKKNTMQYLPCCPLCQKKRSAV